MNKVSLELNNSKIQHYNDSCTNNYSPSYLAKKGECDSVNFTGKTDILKKPWTKIGAIAMAAITTIGAAFGIASCNNSKIDDISSDTSIVNNVDTAKKSADGYDYFNVNSQIPVATIFSTRVDKGEKIEVKKFPNALKIIDDKVAPDNLKNNSTTHVIKNHSNETDKCTTLQEAINKQYVEPFIENGSLPELPTKPEVRQIAAEIIEDNEDMQKKIAEHYNVSDWKEADIDNVLNDDLYKMGIMKFKTPDQVEIHGISTKSPLGEKSESKTTLYSASTKTVELKHDNIKSVEDIYATVAAQYKASDGKETDATAGSIGTWFMIKENQYNKAFEGKINNDGDRTDLMLLDTINGLKKGESLTLNLPDTFGINYVASGKQLNDVKEGQAYHIVHQMTPSENSFELNSKDVVSDSEKTDKPFDFVDILQYYYDPDTEEPLATKTKQKDGSYEFRYNLNVADLNAKQYAVYEQVAYDNMDFFASKQKIDVDGEVQEFEYGVFDVQKGHEKYVKDAIDIKDYDSAKKYLSFNVERFESGEFYNPDGTLKTGAENLKINLKQFEYTSESEGKKVNIKKVTPQKPDPVVPSEPSVPETSRPESSKPETSRPESSAPETSKPESSVPETSRPESSVPETSKPESSTPEISKPESSRPEYSRPEPPVVEDNPNPDVSIPTHTSIPEESSKPETSKPESSKPETSKPESSKPETSRPESSRPESSDPDCEPEDIIKPDAFNKNWDW